MVWTIDHSFPVNEFKRCNGDVAHGTYNTHKEEENYQSFLKVTV